MKSLTSVNPIIIIIVLLFSANVSAEPQVFSKAAFEEIKQQHLGKQWLMILWSVDCPACFKELALIQKIKGHNPAIDVVIINVDDNDEVSEERQQVVTNYGLSSLPNYYFSDGEGDRARFIIDSAWYGELPRSYFVESNGKFHGKSGLVNEKLVRKWLVDN
ncbi:TlpA family protein disulfide reductase [Colwelliaceae bacterium 6441]